MIPRYVPVPSRRPSRIISASSDGADCSPRTRAPARADVCPPKHKTPVPVAAANTAAKSAEIKIAHPLPKFLPFPKCFSKRFSQAAGIIFLCAFALVFALFPERYVPVCLSGITLWALNVLPAVFPFFFVSSLLRLTGGAKTLSKLFSPLSKLLFGTKEGGFCVFMSALSGYPVGAGLVAGMRKENTITSAEAAILSCVSSTSGPLFVLGTVGAGMFKNKRIGLLILAAHLLAVLLSGIALRLLFLLRDRRRSRFSPSPSSPRRNPEEKNRYQRPAAKASVSDCVSSSVLSALCVGGCIALFYVLSAVLSDFGILVPLEKLIGKIPDLSVCAEGLAKGLIEMTSGCLAISALSTPLAAPCCAFLITLGGASILFQQASVLRGAGIRLSLFFPVKLLQAALAFLLCLLFL